MNNLHVMTKLFSDRFKDLRRVNNPKKRFGPDVKCFVIEPMYQFFHTRQHIFYVRKCADTTPIAIDCNRLLFPNGLAAPNTNNIAIKAEKVLIFTARYIKRN